MEIKYKCILMLKRSRRNWIIAGCIGTFLSWGVGGIIGLNLDHHRTLKVCTDNAYNVIQSAMVEGIEDKKTFQIKGIRNISFVPSRDNAHRLIISGCGDNTIQHK